MTLNEALTPILCAVLAVACSSQSQNIQQVVMARTPAAASTPTSATAADPLAPKVDPALVKEGYRVERRQGKILYCQSQTVTGTKFASTTCMTAEQIQELKRETELSKRLLIRSGPATCVGVSCTN